MRGLVPIFICALTLGWAAPLRAEEAPTDAQIGQWIEQHGSEEFDTREAASIRLLAMGQAALPLLEALSKESADPEVRIRANQVLERHAEIKRFRQALADLDAEDLAQALDAAETIWMEGIKKSARFGQFVAHNPISERGKDIKAILLRSVPKFNANNGFKAECRFFMEGLEMELELDAKITANRKP